MKEYSFNFIDKNNTKHKELYYNYRRYGDITMMPYGLLLTPNIKTAFGLICSHNVIHSTKFEFQITFRTNRQSRYGSLFTIWFYKDNDNNIDNASLSLSNDNNYLGFVNQFKGFGIAVITKPKEYIKAKAIIKLILNENMAQLPQEEEIDEETKEFSCIEALGSITKLTIRYDKGDISVFNNSTDSLLNPCFSFKEDDLLGNEFKCGFGSKNGIIDDVIFKDSIIVNKVSLFNRDKKSIDLFKSKPIEEDSESRIHYNRGIVC